MSDGNATSTATPPAAAAPAAGDKGTAAPAAAAAPILKGDGGGNEFLSSLPEDIRSEASLKDIKDVASLAKGYVHAQKLVGTDKVALPKEGADPKEWDAFYEKLGRPKTPTDYKFTEVKFPEGFALDTKLQERFAGTFHKHGLNTKQADALRSEFVQYQLETVQGEIARQNSEVAKGEAALKEKWGADYEKNVKKAEIALKRFSSPELLQALHKSGLGSHPGIVEAFAEIGGRMTEDNATGTGAGNLGGVEAAKAEITKLTKDVEFQKKLHDQFHKDHKDAVKTWTEAHQKASTQ